MSAYRDSLTDEQKPLFDQACRRAAQLLARGRFERDIRTPEDAARLAYTPGGPPLEEITQMIVDQRVRARARLAANAA